MCQIFCLNFLAELSHPLYGKSRKMIIETFLYPILRILYELYRWINRLFGSDPEEKNWTYEGEKTLVEWCPHIHQWQRHRQIQRQRHWLNAGWQKLCEGTKGLYRKVWTWTKVLSTNIRYFVAKLRFVAIFALFWRFGANKSFFGTTIVFHGQELHCYILICKFAVTCK